MRRNRRSRARLTCELDALRWAALVSGVPIALVRIAVEAGAPKELVSSLGRELQ